MSGAMTRGLNRGGSALLLTLLVVFLVAPLVVVVLMSFTNQIYLTFPPTGLVMRWYIAAWNDRAGSMRVGTASRSAPPRRSCRWCWAR